MSVFLNDIERWNSVLPANGGELGLLLHLLSKHLQLLLEGFFVVVGVNIVVVWNHRRQELWTGEAEQLLKHLQVSDMRKETFVEKLSFYNSVLMYGVHPK